MSRELVRVFISIMSNILDVSIFCRAIEMKTKAAQHCWIIVNKRVFYYNFGHEKTKIYETLEIRKGY